MRRFIAGTLVGATLAGSATAVAATSWQHYQHGVLCKSTNHGAVCVTDQLSVGISKVNGMTLALVTDHNNRILYQKFVYGG